MAAYAMALTVAGKQVGLFGGSFDPPHHGHMALVQAGLDLGLNEVWVIPALPVHRKLSGFADAKTRFDWLKKMFADQPEVQVVDWEIRRQRPTSAIETLRQFHQIYPATAPWLMVGADAWAGLPTWRQYPAHRELCNVLVFARRGMALETVCGHHGWKRTDLNDGLDCRTPAHWAYIEAALPDISATGLRHDACQGKSLAGKVPDIVCRQIEQAYGKATEKM